MERSRAYERWAGASMGLIALLVGVVELVQAIAAAEGPAFPVAWVVAYVAYVVVFVLISVGAAPSEGLVQGGTVALLVLTACGVVLLSPSGPDFSVILLVFAAALASYYVRAWVAAAIVLVQTAVIAASFALDPPVNGTEMIVMVAVYGILQAATVGVALSQRRADAVMRELAAAHVELRTASALLASSSQAEERLRIARELHDVLGHQLTALALQLEIATHQTSGAAAEHVGRARALAGDLLTDVRGVVGEERSRRSSVRAQIESITAEVPVPSVHLEIDPNLDDDPGLDEQLSAALVRCVQELVTNTIRHSDAPNLWLTLSRQPEAVSLTARDDGIGASAVTFGHGLTGLTERVEALGGTVEVSGSNGFMVSVMFPLSQAAVLAEAP